MTANTNLRKLMYSAADYRICVCGGLGPEWSERLSGMTVSISERSDCGLTTEINGRLPDQAALMGVLQQLYDCGAPCSAWSALHRTSE